MPRYSKPKIPLSFSLQELADHLGGRVEGDPDRTILGVKGIEEAGPEDITFLANPRYAAALAGSSAGAVIVGEDYNSPGLDLIRLANPYLAFARALALYNPVPKPAPGVSDDAYVSPEAAIDGKAVIMPMSFLEEGSVVGAGTVISPLVFVGRDSRIGSDCHIHPGVTIREGVEIGDRVIIHSGAVIGSDGFGYAKEGQVYHKIPQVGGVVVEDDVEIGACVTVDRGTMGNTRIGRGSKIDNLVQIAHNVTIGEGSIIIAQVGISGSTRIGRGVTLAGQVGVVGHIEIGDFTMVGAQSGVHRSLPPRGAFSGSPPLPHRDFLQMAGTLKYLPEMRRELKRLSEIVRKLEAAGGSGTAEEPGGQET
jgi:UDP-3-O-[3-hydroxymyristoyl] glucosamine N-acyltransferase